ncbi:MAG TPA: hypothetical protein VML92_02355 [Steroidobacteraceae bacterium]|nr:hypothetical protein [Steroidobacteraceae bacterium]
MSADAAVPIFSLVERDGPCARRVLRSEAAEGVQLIIISEYRGPALPARLTRPEIPGGVNGHGWRLSSAEGVIEFHARAVDRIDCRAALYGPLHAPFALSVADRAAVRLLLRALRLPGGARLLRWWQSRR